MAVREARRFSAARRPLQKAALDEKRLVHVFNRVLFFADGGGQRIETDRPVYECEQTLLIHVLSKTTSLLERIG